MKIVLAADHGGFELKEEIKGFLGAGTQGKDIIDVGAYKLDPSDDFPEIINSGVSAVLKNKAVGIFVCGTGIGVSMAANRNKGIRAALCSSMDYAVLARQHNDANVLCLGGRFIDFSEAKKIIDAFLNTSFLGGKYQRRQDKLDKD